MVVGSADIFRKQAHHVPENRMSSRGRRLLTTRSHAGCAAKINDMTPRFFFADIDDALSRFGELSRRNIPWLRVDAARPNFWKLIPASKRRWSNGTITLCAAHQRKDRRLSSARHKGHRGNPRVVEARKMGRRPVSIQNESVGV